MYSTKALFLATVQDTDKIMLRKILNIDLVY